MWHRLSRTLLALADNSTFSHLIQMWLRQGLKKQHKCSQIANVEASVWGIQNPTEDVTVTPSVQICSLWEAVGLREGEQELEEETGCFRQCITLTSTARRTVFFQITLRIWKLAFWNLWKQREMNKWFYPVEETTMIARGLTKSVSNRVLLPLPSKLARSITSGVESTQNISRRLTSTAKPSGLTRSAEARRTEIRTS